MKLSLRSKVILAVGLFASLSTIHSAREIYSAWTLRADALKIEHTSRAISALAAATTALSFERSLTQVALNLPDPISPDLRSKLEEQRAKVKASFAEALDLAASTATSDRLAAFKSSATEELEVLDKIRGEADQMAALPLSSRPVDRVKALPADFKRTVAALNSDRLYLRDGMYLLPTSIGILEQIQDKAWQVREFGGRERTSLAIAVATKVPLNDWQRGEAFSLNLRVNEAFADVAKLIDTGHVTGALKTSFEDLQKTYLVDYKQTRERLLSDPAALNATSFAGFFKESSEALGKSEALIRASHQQISRMWEEQAALYLRTLLLEVAAFVAILACAGITLFVVFNLFTRLDTLREVMNRLSSNDVSVDVPDLKRSDEIGSMAATIDVFKRNLIEIEAMRKDQLEGERRLAEQRRSDVLATADRLQKAVGSIIDTVSSSAAQLERAATVMQNAAGNTQSLSSAVASASEQTSANVQGVASASEELSATVSEIGRQVQDSSQIANEAVKQAHETNLQMQELTNAANRIGDVVNLINSIAGQTNLLALNATIEAARAGDAGKGFAVVAQEVKVLAAQTAKATSDIASQIENMQSVTQKAVDVIQAITGTIDRMSEISGAIASAVEEQDATTKEISRNVLEAAKGTSEVASNITDVSKGAEETGSASAQVLASAKQLSRESATLRQEVDAFLATLRAA